MTTQNEERSLPACFAPEITQADLDRYRALIDALPESERRTQETMRKLLEPVQIWYNLPVSLRADVLSAKTPIRKTPVTIVPLEKEHIELLWDLVPYPDEMSTLQQFVHTLQLAEVERNNTRREDYRAALRAYAFKKFFPQQEKQTLVDAAETRRQLAKLAERDINVRANLATLQAAATGFSEAQWADLSAREQQMRQYLRDVQDGSVTCEIAPPVLESTELRDAAGHLAWYVFELALDREPLDVTRLPAV